MMIMWLMVAGHRVQAQKGNTVMADEQLYREIAGLDSLLFDAFNKRNVDGFREYFDTGLEFYHDKSGLDGYAETIGFLQSLANSGNDLKRELVSNSLRVFPIPGYGAMQFGTHRFCHTEQGKQDCGSFPFVHIWQKQETGWKITRVISYDH